MEKRGDGGLEGGVGGLEFAGGVECDEVWRGMVKVWSVEERGRGEGWRVGVKEGIHESQHVSMV